jgi:predicted lipoprotein with Yx(FWY)xxD motif
LWPEFTATDFDKIIKEYKSLKRNFGAVKWKMKFIKEYWALFF